MRLFIALSLPEEVRERLSLLAGGLPGARWVAPESLHLTLRFVGEVDAPQAHDLDDVLSTIDLPEFELTLRGLGTFDEGRRLRSLWAGVEPNETLLRLQAKVESFRTRKETIKATYTAAEAQTRINEAVSGIGDEFGDVGAAIARAEDKTAQMQARAGAIDELIASGALDDASSLNAGDDIARELESMSSQADVEAELAAMKGGKTAPDAITSGESAGSGPILEAAEEKVEQPEDRA